MKFFKHLKVVLKHKRLVFKYACKLGIGWTGFVHDLTKFSHTEFSNSVKYFDGTKSPTIVERKYKEGWSDICVHHTARNKHHWHAWIDFLPNGIIVREIPYKNAVEYVCDIISASKVYHPKNFNYKVVYDYFSERMNSYIMHPQTKEFILSTLTSIEKLGFKKTRKNLKKRYLELHQKYNQTCIIVPFEGFDLHILDIK